MRNGWYRESYRHSLAARGISTSKFKVNRFSYMPRDVVVKVYKFNELSPKAKQKAIEWFRESRSRDGFFQDDFDFLVDDWRHEMNEKYPELQLEEGDVGYDLYHGELTLPSRDINRLVNDKFDNNLYDVEFEGRDLRYDKSVDDDDFSVDLHENKYFDKNNNEIPSKEVEHILKRKALDVVSDIQEDMGKLFKSLREQENYIESDEYAKEEIEANDYEFEEDGDRY